MFPYQIYQALADQRTREGIAAARRHELVTAALQGATPATRSPWRLKVLPARMAALVTGRRGARSAPKAPKATTSTAGPMGCVV
jgi:hypothetical protein